MVEGRYTKTLLTVLLQRCGSKIMEFVAADVTALKKMLRPWRCRKELERIT